MASVGGAAAQGLESGIGIGLRLRAQDNAEQQQLRANTLQDQQLQRQAELDKQGQDDRALDAVNKAFDDLRAEGEGYFAQYGKTVPDEIAGPYKQRVSEVSGTRNELLRKRYEPVIKQREQRARDVAMKLQAGSLDLKDVAAADLYDAVHVLTKRDPSDLSAPTASRRASLRLLPTFTRASSSTTRARCCAARTCCSSLSSRWVSASRHRMAARSWASRSSS